MSSATQKTEFRRKRRHENAGRARKARAARLGTTPAFPLHTPEADANAPNQVSPERDSSQD
jgi:hypothetical protein